MDPEILKRGALVGHHGWPKNKIIGFRWFKKAKITLETFSFKRNIFISIFKFSPFLYVMKACRWNLINVLKFKNALTRKEKDTFTAFNEKRKAGLCFITGCLCKIINNHFFISQAHLQRSFSFLISGWHKKYQKEKLRMANYNIYFKNNLNCFVMNVTQIFFTDKIFLYLA